MPQGGRSQLGQGHNQAEEEVTPEELEEFLAQYENKRFVQRVLFPDGNYIRRENGAKATHQMAAEIDPHTGQAYAFPMIVDKGTGELYEYDDPFEALEYNLSTGNAIGFPDIDAAITFTRTYKPKSFSKFYQDQ